ncbi:MAG: HIT family protein [Schleiferiaceae bacterium]|jgi:histidine triad (HIT) family protein|nr:HIT family protein [Schleiferiaceae bacterium]MDP4628576.1 HIT family protein [Schleiferiaceae bacterium]MDP4742879.1 HIT family protein [Schleiferiaceae bacterium]MDP4932868.1 HIT family protein [Schleiferiaceae bacterium]
MASIFSRIIAGEIPCHRVAETDRAIAFLDIRPLTEGHTLVVPKAEVDSIFDLDSEDYQAVFDLVRAVSEAQKAVVPCTRIGLTVLGFEVPHAHVHVVPLRSEADLNFANPKLQLDSLELEGIAKRLRAAILVESL